MTAFLNKLWKFFILCSISDRIKSSFPFHSHKSQQGLIFFRNLNIRLKKIYDENNITEQNICNGSRRHKPTKLRRKYSKISYILACLIIFFHSEKDALFAIESHLWRITFGKGNLINCFQKKKEKQERKETNST